MSLIVINYMYEVFSSNFVVQHYDKHYFKHTQLLFRLK